MQNKIMLITYPDSFGRNLKELYQAIHTHFARELGAIHILPLLRRPGLRPHRLSAGGPGVRHLGGHRRSGQGL